MFSRKVKVGIAFGGGGARGLTHLGAIKAFEEFGLKFDFVAGTSAGSIAGAFYAAGYTYKQMYNIIKNLSEKEESEVKTSTSGVLTRATKGIRSKKNSYSLIYS